MKLIRLARDGRGDGGSFDSGNDNSDTLNRHGNIFYFPAHIENLVNNDETVYIDYLKRDFDNPKIVLKHTSEREKNWIIPFQDIVMALPEPKEIRRDRFIFDNIIKLT